VVRHGRTVVQDVQAAKDALDAVSARVVGSVLTMVSYGGTRAHARAKPRRGRKGSQPHVLPPVTGASVPTSGAAPKRDRPQGTSVTLGDQRTVMLVAPQPGAQQARQQVPRSAPQQAQRPAPPASQDSVQASPASSQGTVPAPLPVSPGSKPDAVPAPPQDAEAVVPREAEQGGPQDTTQDVPHAGSTARNGQQGPKERPAPRPRTTSDANGQTPDHDGATAR
jgi:hypothetical protein